MSFAYKFDGGEIPSTIYSGDYDRHALEMADCVFSDIEYDWTRTVYRNGQFIDVSPAKQEPQSVMPEPQPYEPTEMEKLTMRKLTIKAELAQLDAKSIRSIREIALGQTVAATYLVQYDALAAQCRAALGNDAIPWPIDEGNDWAGDVGNDA